MRSAAVLLPLFAGLSLLPAGETPPKSAPRSLVPTVQEVIFYTERKPVRILVHIETASGSVEDAFRKKLKAFFDYLDRDGDGFLNRDEAQYAFSNAGLQSLIETGYGFASPSDPTRAFDLFDGDKDGRISFAEFAVYYAPCGRLLIAPKQLGAGDAYAAEVTRELFARLDADKDGKISREELAVLPSWIEKFDRDEDDCLSLAEIIPDIQSRKKPETDGPDAAPDSLKVYPPGEFSETAIETLMKRYDRGRNLRLKPADIDFAAELFKKLDRNGDGTLSMFELAEWRALPPDLEIEMRLGGTREESKIALRKPSTGDYPLASHAAIQPNGNLLLKIGNQSIDFGFLIPAATSKKSAAVSDDTRNDLLATFDRANRGKDHVVDGDIGTPEFQHLRIVFDMADRNTDGKVTRGELEALVKLFESFRTMPIYLAHVVETPSIFRVLDQNGDGRLSLRELRQAWDRLHPLEPNGGDSLTPNLLKPQARVYLTREAEVQNFVLRNSFQINVNGDGRGPIWFQKLDRNGDGDISLKEFPGTKAEFDRLDLNGDGLISLDEAEAAEKRYRRK